jgi:hypothetical protein
MSLERIRVAAGIAAAGGRFFRRIEKTMPFLIGNGGR